MTEVERAVRAANLTREVAGAPLRGRRTRAAPPALRSLPPPVRDETEPALADHDEPATPPAPPADAAPPPWPPQRPALQAPTAHSLRKSLNKAAFLLATGTGRHPGAVNTELNGVMGVDQRAQATKEQLREGLRYVGDQLRKSRDTTFSGDPPF